MSEPNEGALTLSETGSGTSQTRRSMLLTMLAVAAGALISIWSLGQVWASSTYNDSITNQTESVTGSTLYPISVVGAWIALASVLAVFATSGRARWALGALILVCGAAIVTSSMAFILTKDALRFSNALADRGVITIGSGWAITGIAGLLVAAAGVVTILKGAQWRGLSARQLPSDAAAAKPASTPWEALDRGEDPTATK